MISRKLFFQSIAVFLLFFGCSLGAFAASEPTDSEILRKADEARGNAGGVTWEVFSTTQEGDRTIDLKCEVMARGFDVLVKILSPPKFSNSKILMLNGSIWFHKPGLSRAVPISARQKLMGSAVYADIAAINYAADYEASRLSPDTIAGEPCYVFFLKAKSRQCAYDRIMYWVSKSRLVGIKADYYTLSGKKIKSCRMEYDNTVRRDGREDPFISSLEINDELAKAGSTRLNFRKPILQPLADDLFDPDSIAK
ncbi:MAG: outer membrane lipoprotein-sorting protein [Desulfobacteraceae bacterium]|nr:outer membrane lipoprotein-sorting protein [Desulfobacteraceae bacterium]